MVTHAEELDANNLWPHLKRSWSTIFHCHHNTTRCKWSHAIYDSIWRSSVPPPNWSPPDAVVLLQMWSSNYVADAASGLERSNLRLHRWMTSSLEWFAHDLAEDHTSFILRMGPSTEDSWLSPPTSDVMYFFVPPSHYQENGVLEMSVHMCQQVPKLYLDVRHRKGTVDKLHPDKLLDQQHFFQL